MGTKIKHLVTYQKKYIGLKYQGVSNVSFVFPHIQLRETVMKLELKKVMKL